MLTMRNAGKYLSKTWHNDREKAMKDSLVSGIYSQTELELSNAQIGGVYDNDTYIVKTTPIDSETTAKDYNIRDDPKIGD